MPSPAPVPQAADPFESLFVSAPDGLRLHVRACGQGDPGRLPVLALPGLARTAADFDALAVGLAADPDTPHRTFALDSRGRGRSEYDRKANYTLAVELADVQAVLTALGAEPAVIVGTSRGGLLAMLLAVARPDAIAGVVLNDIGPVIEPQGLFRIKSYVGKLPTPRSFDEGADILRRLFDAQFPRLGPADWLAAAHRTWQERSRKLVPTYDVRLSRTMKSFDPQTPIPALWKEFDALAHVPLMVIRGAKSDLLSEATVAAMAARRTAMETIVVPDQGHAPLLAEPEVIARIGAFIRSCERAGDD